MPTMSKKMKKGLRKMSKTLTPQPMSSGTANPQAKRLRKKR